MTDPFELLPFDQSYEIFEYLTPIDLLLGTRLVWRQNNTAQIICKLLFKYYQEERRLLDRLKISDHINGLKSNLLDCFDCFLNSFDEKLIGLKRKFLLFAFKYEIYQFSERVFKCGKNFVGEFSNEAHWIHTDMTIYKKLFENSQRHCKEIINNQQEIHSVESMMNTPTNATNNSSISGFFSSILNFFTNSKSESSTKNQNISYTINNNNLTNSNNIENQNSSSSGEYDLLVKVLLDGCSLSGRTSFFNCVINNQFSNHSNVFLEFALKNYHFGNYKIKLQTWDSVGRERYRAIARAYYRGCSMIILMVDPFSEWNIAGFKGKILYIKENVPKETQVVIVSTMSDLEKEKILTNEQADYLAFKEFNSLHFNVSCKQNVEAPQMIALFSVILKYVMM